MISKQNSKLLEFERFKNNLSDEIKENLISEGIDPSNVLSFVSKYNKFTNTITTRFILNDGKEHELIENCVWFASRKNKRW